MKIEYVPHYSRFYKSALKVTTNLWDLPSIDKYYYKTLRENSIYTIRLFSLC